MKGFSQGRVVEKTNFLARGRRRWWWGREERIGRQLSDGGGEREQLKLKMEEVAVAVIDI